MNLGSRSFRVRSFWIIQPQNQEELRREKTTRRWKTAPKADLCKTSEWPKRGLSSKAMKPATRSTEGRTHSGRWANVGIANIGIGNYFGRIAAIFPWKSDLRLLYHCRPPLNSRQSKADIHRRSMFGCIVTKDIRRHMKLSVRRKRGRLMFTWRISTRMFLLDSKLGSNSTF